MIKKEIAHKSIQNLQHEISPLNSNDIPSKRTVLMKIDNLDDVSERNKEIHSKSRTDEIEAKLSDKTAQNLANHSPRNKISQNYAKQQVSSVKKKMNLNLTKKNTERNFESRSETPQMSRRWDTTPQFSVRHFKFSLIITHLINSLNLNQLE